MALMKMKSVIDQLAKNSPNYVLHVVVWFLGQIVGIGKILTPREPAGDQCFQAL
jgi:hypothetical protein